MGTHTQYQFHQITKKTRLTSKPEYLLKFYFQQLATTLNMGPCTCSGPAPATVAPAANAPLAGIKSMTARMIPTRKRIHLSRSFCCLSLGTRWKAFSGEENGGS